MSGIRGEGQATETNLKREPDMESPSEKLRDELPPGSPVPGAQNPDSEEVKKEIKPNTE